MEKEELLQRILETEWDMFRTVNGEDRVSCQEDPVTFSGMRRAQFRVWSAETLESYLADLTEAVREGRNLLRDKYLYMMILSGSRGSSGTGIPPEKSAAAEEIWSVLLPQTQRLRKQFPLTAARGRRLKTEEETGGYPSVETYQKGELLTYSLRTLRSLLDDIRRLEREGIEYAQAVQENSVRSLGWDSLEQAEAALRGH